MNFFPNEYLSPEEIRKHVDKNIQNLIIKMNELPYLQTTYSCGGHYRLLHDSPIINPPCVDFFCAITTRFQPHLQLAALRFLKKFEDRLCAYTKETLPKVVIHSIRAGDHTAEQNGSAWMLEPELKHNKSGGCSFNGSRIGRGEGDIYFLAQGDRRLQYKATKAMRKWHLHMIRDLEALVVMSLQEKSF